MPRPQENKIANRPRPLLNYKKFMSEAYQVIARRWRPRQFTELVGQDHIVRTLSNAIEQDRIAHAYLFVGPRGTGKTTTARLFAKSLNWEDGPSIETPESTELCDAIMRGECLDVIEIDGASNNGVDQVRALREECAYAPAQCRFKIYIIDEVHMLTNQAWNALLKTLEEPPAHVKFIFATTEANKVLRTVLSRCQRFEFRAISSETIAAKLTTICETEGINASPDALDIIARIAEGGMRDAQSTLDQLITFCGNAISKKDVNDVFGLVDPDTIQSLADTLLASDYGELLGTVAKIADEGRDLYRLLRDLRDHFRERLVETVRSDTDGRADALSRILDVLQQGEAGVQGGLSQLVNLETTLLKAVEQGKTRAIDSLIKDITALSKNLPADEAPKKKLSTPNQAPETKSPCNPEPVPEPEPIAAPEPEPPIPQVVEEPPAAPEVPQHEPAKFAAEYVGLVPQDAYEDVVPTPPPEIEEPVTAKAAQEIIQQRVDALPQDFRDFMEETFRAQYVNVRPVDPKVLLASNKL